MYSSHSPPLSSGSLSPIQPTTRTTFLIGGGFPRLGGLTYSEPPPVIDASSEGRGGTAFQPYWGLFSTALVEYPVAL